jgi:hypothetical protein
MNLELNEMIGFGILALIIGMQLVVLWGLEEIKKRDELLDK